MSAPTDGISSFTALALQVHDSMRRFSTLAEELDSLGRTKSLLGEMAKDVDSDYTKWLGASREAVAKLSAIIRAFNEETIPLAQTPSAGSSDQRFLAVGRMRDRVEQATMEIHRTLTLLSQTLSRLRSVRESISASESRALQESAMEMDRARAEMEGAVRRAQHEQEMEEAQRRRGEDMMGLLGQFGVDFGGAGVRRPLESAAGGGRAGEAAVEAREKGEAKLQELERQLERKMGLSRQVVEASSVLLDQMGRLQDGSGVFPELCQKLHEDCCKLGDCLRYTKSAEEFLGSYERVGGEVGKALDGYCTAVEQRRSAGV